MHVTSTRRQQSFTRRCERCGDEVEDGWCAGCQAPRAGVIDPYANDAGTTEAPAWDRALDDHAWHDTKRRVAAHLRKSGAVEVDSLVGPELVDFCVMLPRSRDVWAVILADEPWPLAEVDEVCTNLRRHGHKILWLNVWAALGVAGEPFYDTVVGNFPREVVELHDVALGELLFWDGDRIRVAYLDGDHETYRRALEKPGEPTDLN
jgi:hypothetical protein